MRRFRWFLLSLIWVSGLSSAQTVLQEPAIDLLVTPTLLLGQGRYAQAADSFHAQSRFAMTLERKIGAKQMWQVAGLADGLAAIAAEKNNDPIAYEYWANSVRYFLMSGSSWEEVQRNLHTEYEQSNSRLQVNMPVGDSGVNIDNQWLELYSLVEVWQQRLAYFSYQKPSSNLATKTLQVSQSEQAQTAADGAQLKQYSPNNALKLDSGFATKQTFVPNKVAQQSNPKIQEMLDQKSVQPKQKKSEPTVIAHPLGSRPEIIEQDMKQQPITPQQSEQPLKQSEGSDDEQAKFRGNLGAQSGKGVTATQRRSFAPTVEEDK